MVVSDNFAEDVTAEQKYERAKKNRKRKKKESPCKGLVENVPGRSRIFL